MRGWVMAAAAMVMAAPASAQIVLEPGQVINMQVGATGQVFMSTPAPAVLGPGDLAFLAKIRAANAAGSDYAMTTAPEGMTMPPIQPNQVELIFATNDNTESVLIVSNGYPEAMVYRAVIYGNGRSAPTDVCLVIPGQRTYEHWPFPIARIELSEVRLVPWKAGDPIPCR